MYVSYGTGISGDPPRSPDCTIAFNIRGPISALTVRGSIVGLGRRNAEPNELINLELFK